MGADRWLAVIVEGPSRFADDPAQRFGAQPIILNEKGALLSDMDFSVQGAYKGYVFAPTPHAARMISEGKRLGRADKGDLPPAPAVGRKYGAAALPGLYGRAAVFVAPDESLWPSVTFSLSGGEAGTVETAFALEIARTPEIKVPLPVRKADVAARRVEPLALVPKAAIAAIEAAAEAQAAAESGGTLVASLANPSIAQNGYARAGDDPRAVFEAVLVRRDGRAELPDAPEDILEDGPRDVPETPLSAAIEEESRIPVPRLKPEGAPAPDLAEGKPKRKLHFWAAFKLPGSIYKKSQQRCLAAGIYFEARGEPERGQAAVAQVILNRVRAPSYPDTICGVVYQNKDLRNRCQFSFACDGVYDRIRDKEAWERAVRIARDVSRGDIYIDTIADSTHYHATYVAPRWRRDMKVVDRIGTHIFYRTKNGGWS